MTCLSLRFWWFLLVKIHFCVVCLKAFTHTHWNFAIFALKTSLFSLVTIFLSVCSITNYTVSNWVLSFCPFFCLHVHRKMTREQIEPFRWVWNFPTTAWRSWVALGFRHELSDNFKSKLVMVYWFLNWFSVQNVCIA